MELATGAFILAPFLLAAGASTGPALADSSRPPFEQVTIERDLLYGEDPKYHALDVYRPEGADKPLPLVVFIHGGGWSEGDKGRHPRKGTWFARSGFVYATVNYRLSPKVKHPAHVQDVARALAWLHQNAARFNADPSRVYLVGHSAGAHLAALVATDPRHLEQHGLSPAIIDGVALLDGSGYDVHKRMPTTRGWMRQMYRNAFGEDPQLWKDASPALHVRAERPLPSFLIFHVTKRPQAIKQAALFAEALKRAGGQATVVPVRTRNHATINRRLGMRNDLVGARILSFFRGELTPK